MYPRNAASPPRIAVGAVVQISDGAVQSAGVSIAVRGTGAGTESAGGGTTSYGGSSNIVYYVPTQAETNQADFVVTAYKTGCIPVSQTIVTSAASVAGQVDVWGISGDSTAADNCEAFFDGTGYAGTNNVIPTVTTVNGLAAGAITAAAVATDAIDADALAADALAEIKTQATTALSDIDLDHLISTDLPTNWATDVNAGSALGELGGATFNTATDSQEALRVQGDAAWTTATSVTVSDKTGFSLLATTGLGNQTANITGTIDTVTDVTNLHASAATAAAQITVDQIWDELLAGHTTPDSAGLVLNELQDGGRLDLILDTIAADVVNVDGYNLATQIGTAGAALTDLGGMSTGMKAEVNTEVVDTLNTDTYAELTDVPAATVSLVTKLGWLYMLARNQVEQTATTQTLRADDTTTSIGTSTVSDSAGTFTRGEWTDTP